MPATRIVIALELCALAALVTAAVLWPAPVGGPGGVAHAQTWTLAQTFLNPNPPDDDNFGYSVAAVGGNVLVGARLDDTGAINAGAAYLFDGASGALLHTFLNPTPAADDQFGISVAGVGGNVLVGAFHDDTGAFNAGAAYLFDGATGVLLHTFLNPTPAFDDQFGYSVAGVGSNVLVGAFHDDTGAINTGEAYLFDGASGVLLHTFLNPTPAFDDQFGISVAAAGGNVLVGATGDDTGAFDAGAAYLFDASTGTLLRTFLNPTPAPNDSFGWSVAAVEGDILVGAPFTGVSAAGGAAYLFDGGSGAHLRTFLDPTTAPDGSFGWSVAAVGGNILVGAPLAGVSAAGAAYLFDGATGALLQTFLPSPAFDDYFGYSVAALGGDVLVGAPYAASQAGEAYLFQAEATPTPPPASTASPTQPAGTALPAALPATGLGGGGDGPSSARWLAATVAGAIALGCAAWYARKRRRAA